MIFFFFDAYLLTSRKLFLFYSRLGVETPNSSELTMYSATKHALQELSKGLRMEMRQKKTNIRVSVRKKKKIFLLEIQPLKMMNKSFSKF